MYKNSLNIKRLTIFVLILLFAFSASAQTVNWEWVRHAGGGGDDIGYAITCDHESNIIITGRYCDYAQFGDTILPYPGFMCGIFVSKLDSSGNFIWTKSMYGTYIMFGYSVTVHQNSIYVVGQFEATMYLDDSSYTSSGSVDAFIAKLDNNGNYLWCKTFGGNSVDRVTNIASNNDGDLFICGTIEDTVVVGADTIVSPYDTGIYTAKINSDGDFQWIKMACDGTGNNLARGIAVDSFSNVYITGKFVGNTTFIDTLIYDYGLSDVFILKIDSSGNFIWAHKMGGYSTDYSYSVTVDNDENVFVKGYFRETGYFGDTSLISSAFNNLFVAKLNSHGDFLWTKSIMMNFYATYDGYKNSIACDSLGNLYITGWFLDTLIFDDINLISNGEHDFFVIKIDPSGKPVWGIATGELSEDFSRSICLDSDGGIYITGRFYNTCDFGDYSITSYGSADVFIAKIHENPVGGIDHFSTKNSLLIFPNPSNDVICIRNFTGKRLSGVEVYSIDGKINILNIQDSENINVSNLPNGIYFLRLHYDSEVITEKIVIY